MFLQDIAVLALAKLLLPAAVISLLIWALLSPPFTMPIWNSFMFHPAPPIDEPAPESIYGSRCQEVYFPTPDGERLHGWFFHHPSARKTLLISHGNSGSIADRIILTRILLNAGASVFVYDYRGYGNSTGDPSVDGLKADGLAAYDYLVDKLKIPPASIILYGESMGTGISCHISSQRSCGGLILQSGFSSLRLAGQQIYPLLKLYPIWLFPAPNLDNVFIVSRPHPPLLIIHGAKDTLLPFTHAQTLFEKATEPKTLVKLPDGEHSNLTYFPEFAAAVHQFLARLPQQQKVDVSS